MEDPRPTTRLDDAAAWPFEDGMDEVVIRISRYHEDGSPACFQAIVKKQDRTKAWGVGIGTNPVVCINNAIQRAYESDQDWPSGEAGGWARAPLAPGASGYEMARAETIGGEGTPVEEPEEDDLDALL